MRIKDYLSVIRKYKILILVTAFLCGIFALILSLIYPQSYDVQVLLAIHRVNREQTADFQYDNYYSIQAAEHLSNTVVSWLETPGIVLEIFKKADLESEIKDINVEVKKIRPKQISSHLVRVKLNHKNQEKAKKLASALVSVIDDRVQSIEQTADAKNSFEVKAEEPIIILRKYDPPLATLFGFIGGLFLGIGFAFFYEYLKSEKD